MAPFDKFKKEIENLPANSPLHKFASDYEKAADKAEKELRERQQKEWQERFGK